MNIEPKIVGECPRQGCIEADESLRRCFERMDAHPPTTIELTVRSRRFGTFRKAMQVESARDELERDCLKGAADTLKMEMENWFKPQSPDPITAALAGMVEKCPGCGGMPSTVWFQAASVPTACLACMNPACPEHTHTGARKMGGRVNDMALLAEWNHWCMVAREKREKREGAK